MTDTLNTDEIWKRNEVDSPCVKLCVLHPAAGICMGCYRTGDEIANWSTMADTERKELKDSLAGRESLLRDAAALSPARMERMKARQARRKRSTE